MKLAPTSVGAEPKKVALLAGIVILAGVVYWFENRTPGGDTVSASMTPASVSVTPAPAAPSPAVASPAPSRTTDAPSPVLQRRYPGRTSLGDDSEMGDFHPTLKVKEDTDLSKVDPRIRLDLLAKVRAVPMEGGSSSLFEFGKPPAPPAPKVEIKPTSVPPPPVTVSKLDTGKPKPPPTPPPTPVPFKYYGYAGKSADGQLQEGFFLEGDRTAGDIYPVQEGQTLQNRYKIVRIGVRSAVVEDTVDHHQQTLPILEEQP